MSYTTRRAIIIAIIDGNQTIKQTAIRFGKSERQIRRYLKEWKEHGAKSLEPKSKAPHHKPTKTPPEIENQIIKLRKTLISKGLDAGAATIHAHLPETLRPSVTTIWRILKKHQLVTPQPQKRPRTSWQRFQAPAPNSLWQSDFTHIRLEDGTDIEVISWLDDHSRYLLHISAHKRVTGKTVIETFTETIDKHGLPAATLTDNGMVYTTRLAGGYKRRNQPNAFEQLLADLNIEQRNGRPGKPTTQGKIERFHQTLKRWISAQHKPKTMMELQFMLQEFQNIYNKQRPHRALNNHTPWQAYTAADKDFPSVTDGKDIWRVRYDVVDTRGKISIRYANRMRHLYVGYSMRAERVITLIKGQHAQVIHPKTGEIIAEYVINPNKSYQAKQQ